MVLTKNDLQSIKGVVEEVVERVVEDRIQASEARMKEFIRSEFRINNMVLDTRFRKNEIHLQNHEKRITVLEG